MTIDKIADKIKNFIYKKTSCEQIITKKIFGLDFVYSKGKYYKGCLALLKIVKNNIDDFPFELIEDFKKKARKHYINSEVFKQDRKKISKILDKINPSNLPKAKGKLRETQLKELSFAKEIIDDIEKNTNILPFMDDGTLLGAVRHKGFIPWDDDMDFSLLRDDFEKLKDYLKEKYIMIDVQNWSYRSFGKNLNKYLKKYQNQVLVVYEPMALKCFKGNDKNHVTLDFFPLDYYMDDLTFDNMIEFINKVKNKNPKCSTFSRIFNYYKFINEKYKYRTAKSAKIAPAIDNYDFHCYSFKGFRMIDNVFPLRKLKFEDCEFWAPNNYDAYLNTIYSDYKKLPFDIISGLHGTYKDSFD